MVKADLFCSSVAAASVLAKVERDAMMVALAAEVPGYAWELNKGYSAPEHFAALESRGPTVHHRRSWRLPGVSSPDAGHRAVGGTGVPESPLMHDDGADRAFGRSMAEAVTGRGSHRAGQSMSEVVNEL
jgi:ribonuclease HII